MKREERFLRSRRNPRRGCNLDTSPSSTTVIFPSLMSILSAHTSGFTASNLSSSMSRYPLSFQRFLRKSGSFTTHGIKSTPISTSAATRASASSSTQCPLAPHFRFVPTFALCVMGSCTNALINRDATHRDIDGEVDGGMWYRMLEIWRPRMICVRQCLDHIRQLQAMTNRLYSLERQ